MCEHLVDLEVMSRWLHAGDQNFLVDVSLKVLSLEKQQDSCLSLLVMGDMKKRRLGWRKHSRLC